MLDLETRKREPVYVEDMRRPQPRSSPPRAGALDYAFAFAIGLHLAGAAVCLVVAAHTGTLGWWCVRTGASLPLLLLTAALVARSLQRRDRRR